tara:strand:- start:4754 stop:5101 length:348 start_codon:yes stop_codon:yes gene_type:complete
MVIIEEKDNELVSIEIDFHKLSEMEINEGLIRVFGGAIQTILGRMFGGASVPVNIKGTPAQVGSFTKAMGNEKRYIQTAAKYGLNDPRTYKNKYKLKQATANFERITGIKWPFEG